MRPGALSAETDRPQSAFRLSDHSLSDLLGGRVLAWTGGAATLTGIILFLALAISADGSASRLASHWPGSVRAC